jgi:hypothetical protein
LRADESINSSTDLICSLVSCQSLFTDKRIHLIELGWIGGEGDKKKKVKYNKSEPTRKTQANEERRGEKRKRKVCRS